MNLEEQLQDRVDSALRMKDWWLSNKTIYEPVVAELESFGAEARVSYSGVDISMTGGKAELNGLFRILRKNGYVPTHRPLPRESYYAAFFYPEVGDHKAIWLSFSSNVCKRVQVGTKYEEVPVYEVQCSESMEVEDNG